MKKFKSVLLIMISIVLAIAIAGCGNSNDANSSKDANSNASDKTDSNEKPQEKIVMKINNDIAANSIKGESWRYFKDQMEQKVGDKVDIQIYDSSSLYSQSEQLQALQQGNIQFMSPVPGVLTGQFPKLNVFGLPYLFKSPAMISDVVKDEKLTKSLFNDLSDKNVTIMSVWLNGWRMVTSNKPVKSLEDMKGLKIRVPAGDNYVETFKALDSNVVTINWGEVPSSLQQGIIDAVEPTPNANLSSKIYESAKYVTKSDHMLDIYVVATNKEWLEGLPADVKKAVIESIDATEKFNWEKTTKANRDALTELANKGAEFIDLSDEELAKWQEATKPAVDKLAPSIGADILSDIQALGEKFEWERP